MGERYNDGKAKQLSTRVFENEADAIEAHKIREKEVKEKSETMWKNQAMEDPVLKDLELRPERVEDAERGNAYFRPNPRQGRRATADVAMDGGSKRGRGAAGSPLRIVQCERNPPIMPECEDNQFKRHAISWMLHTRDALAIDDRKSTALRIALADVGDDAEKRASITKAVDAAFEKDRKIALQQAEKSYKASLARWPHDEKEGAM